LEIPKRLDALAIQKSCPSTAHFYRRRYDYVTKVLYKSACHQTCISGIISYCKVSKFYPGNGTEMRNWYLPVTLLGLSGLGLIFASKRGRKRVLSFLDRVVENGAPLGEFNKLCEEQLNTIQNGLDRLAEALQESEA
jgi:hypothetical protein